MFGDFVHSDFYNRKCETSETATTTKKTHDEIDAKKSSKSVEQKKRIT